MATEMWGLYNVIRRPGKEDIWQKIGIGFTNADGSINLKFDSFPLLGKVLMQKKEKFDDGDGVERIGESDYTSRR